jgi:hypothetical protein
MLRLCHRTDLRHYDHGSAFGRTAGCDVFAAARAQQGNLRGNDEPVFYHRQRDQGAPVAAAGKTDRHCLDLDGDLPPCHSYRRMARLAALRKAGPAPALSGLLWIAGRHGVQIIVGRYLRLSRVNSDCERLLWAVVSTGRLNALSSATASCWGRQSKPLTEPKPRTAENDSRLDFKQVDAVLLRHLAQEVRMSSRDRVVLSPVEQLLQGIGAGRIEEPIGCFMSVDSGFDHGFVDKTFDGFGYIVLTHPFFYYCDRGIQRERSNENRHTTQYQPFDL